MEQKSIWLAKRHRELRLGRNFLRHFLPGLRAFIGFLWLFPCMVLAQKMQIWKPNSLGQIPSGCSLTTPEQWQNFIAKAANDPLWIKTCEESSCERSDYEHILDVHEAFSKCQSYLSLNPLLKACSDRLNRFSGMWLKQHSIESYGFVMNNDDYLRDQEAEENPENMMLPPAFITENYPDRLKVEAAARANGVKYLTHDSALGGVRTYILYTDPKARFDQWILLNIDSETLSFKEGDSLSLITVQKKNRDGTALEKVKVHFRDYKFVENQKGAHQLLLDQKASGKCYSCHINGVRLLIDRHTPVLNSGAMADEDQTKNPTDIGFSRLREFNRRLRSYGMNDWDHKIRVEDDGPMLGARQGCTACHNGVSRGVLTVSTSPKQIEHKILGDLSMPPTADTNKMLEQEQLGASLYPYSGTADLVKVRAEHARILEEYMKDRLSTLKQWLTEIPCKSP